MSGEVAAFVREQLGHEPNDLGLFELAFTHSSVGRESYERLEFLGDRVLGMVIAARAVRALSRRARRQFVAPLQCAWSTRETCAEIGREIGVPALVRLGKQAREDGASQSDNVVGDVVEALIGALLLDGGLDAAERFILRLWEPHLAEQRRRAAASQVGAAGTGRGARAASLRSMKWSARTGAHHAPKFTVRVSVAQARRSDAPRDRASRKRKPPRPTALLAQLQ